MSVHGLTGLVVAPAKVGFHWLPAPAAEAAGPVDRLFALVGWLGLFALVVLVGLALVLAVHYRRRSEDDRGLDLRGEFPLITALSGTIALAVVGYVYYRGEAVNLDQSVPPSDAYAVVAEADSGRIAWIYPNGHRTDSLHVPAGRPVVVDLVAYDAVYSLTVPAFRLGRDLVPGAANRLWFDAVEPGAYDVFTAEQGEGTAAVQASVITVEAPADFESWLTAASDILAGLTPVEGGRKLYEVLTCITCHTLDGSRLVGPSFKGLLGSERTFADGSRAIADADYVRQSVLEPQALVVAGYDPVMPSFQGRVGDREIEALLAFMTSLDEPVQ